MVFLELVRRAQRESGAVFSCAAAAIGAESSTAAPHAAMNSQNLMFAS
jgi:hypothetical protein